MRIVSIIGCGRSGSTLLEGVLHERLDLTALGEVTFIWEKGWIKDELCGCGVVFRECEFWSAVLRDAFGTITERDARRFDAEFRAARGHLRNLTLAQGRFPEPSAVFIDVARALYASAAKIGGDRPLIDSSKSSAFAAALRHTGIGRQSALHMFRSATGNVHSLRTEKVRPHAATADYARLQSSKTLFHAIARWKLLNEQAQQFSQKVDPGTVTISYESFCATPEQHLEAITAASDFEPRRGSPPDSWHSVSGNPMRFDSTAMPICVDDRWKQEMGLFARMITRALTAGQEARLDVAAELWMERAVEQLSPASFENACAETGSRAHLAAGDAAVSPPSGRQRTLADSGHATVRDVGLRRGPSV
ncbi:MAG: sulfotransferase [Betaproteobacteria bacterium]